ncbi:unnamed protein product, partial [Amoebophrya sp. A25]|eukprot:GSA25T00016507001.1
MSKDYRQPLLQEQGNKNILSCGQKDIVKMNANGYGRNRSTVERSYDIVGQTLLTNSQQASCSRKSSASIRSVSRDRVEENRQRTGNLQSQNVKVDQDDRRKEDSSSKRKLQQLHCEPSPGGPSKVREGVSRELITQEAGRKDSRTRLPVSAESTRPKHDDD